MSGLVRLWREISWTQRYHFISFLNAFVAVHGICFISWLSWCSWTRPSSINFFSGHHSHMCVIISICPSLHLSEKREPPLLQISSVSTLFIDVADLLSHQESRRVELLMVFHLRAMGYASWDHTVLPATLHKWTHPALTPARQAALWFTYPERNKAELT